MDKSVWEEKIGEDANKEGVGQHNRCKGRVRTEEEEGVSAVEGRKRRSKRICKRTAKKEIYLAIKVTANGASVLCGEKRWKEVDGARLQISEQVDG